MSATEEHQNALKVKEEIEKSTILVAGGFLTS